jgi:hypothetical protein
VTAPGKPAPSYEERRIAQDKRAHRTPAAPTAIPGYDKMSFEQKREAQDQRKRNGGTPA